MTHIRHITHREHTYVYDIHIKNISDTRKDTDTHKRYDAYATHMTHREHIYVYDMKDTCKTYI